MLPGRGKGGKLKKGGADKDRLAVGWEGGREGRKQEKGMCSESSQGRNRGNSGEGEMK